MDLAGATKAAAKLWNSPTLASSAPYLTQKANWDIQIRGVYNLLFSHIHDDYAVRDETTAYVADRIDTALKDHNSINKHNGAYSTPGINIPIVPTQINRDQLEKPFIYRNISKNGVTTFVIDVKNPMKIADKIFNIIGYGV